MKDYYRILNVSPASAKQVIRKSYRKLASQFHPDKNQSASAEEKFKQIAEAYDVLSNEEKRKKYDQSRKVVPIDSFQSHSFNKKKHSNKASPPPPKELLDASILLELTLEEAHTGCEKQISFNRIHNNSKEKKQLTIKVPKGFESGKKLRLIGKAIEKEVKKGIYLLK